METPAIQTRSLTKRYGATLAVDALTLAIKRGEVYGLLGPNGAGKTTTIRMLLALARPTSGSAWIMGYDAWRDPVQAHRHIAYVPAELSLWPQLTGGQTLEMLGRLHGSIDRRYRDSLVEQFDLDLKKKVRSYSTGNRQKLGLIAAFMTRADVLILDEPTAGLDPLMVQVYRQCIKEAADRGQTVLVSSHLLSEIEAVCDRIGLLREGTLIDEGPIESLKHISARRLTAVFKGAPPDLSSIAGLHGLAFEDNRVSCLVTGDLSPLLKALATAELEDLTITEPSLEEIFLAHYPKTTTQSAAEPGLSRSNGPQ